MDATLITPAVVVLVGPSASGKSTWAAEHFSSGEIVSSDALRAAVGLGEHDQRASQDAFEALDLIVRARVRRGLTTVIDTLGLDEDLRTRSIALARDAGLAVHAVGFDTPPAVCRSRNKDRSPPVPARVLSSQIDRWTHVRKRLAEEGFDSVHFVGADQSNPPRMRRVPPVFAGAEAAARTQRNEPATLEFGLQVSRFGGETDSMGKRLAGIAAAAETAGFSSLWVMDHFIQIPQVGRAWDNMLESYTTLAYVAAATEQIRLGTLVTAAGYRNPGHLGKIVATLDVVSGGRAICGLGAGWYEKEAKAYGYDFRPASERLDLLEDVLQLLPLMWGPGSPSFEGKVVSVPEAVCYPRPVQERIPILVGGQGERRTLRLVAAHADMCNLFGDAAAVRHKLDVLRGHCADLGRDPAEITVTHLGPATVVAAADQAAVLDRLTPSNRSRDATATAIGLATVEDHVGRFRVLGDAGVRHAIVHLGENSVDAVAAMAPVIAAFQ